MKKIILSIFIFLPLFSFAASSNYTLLEPLPCIQNTGQGESDTACADGTMLKEIKADTYIAYVFNFSIAFAAVAAVVVITYAGFEYAMSDIVTKKSEAKARIGNAIWGLITIISSYFILETIDPRLVNVDTRLSPIEISGEAFNYNELLETVDAKINRDLTEARIKARPLEAEAKLKRSEAAKYLEDAKKATTTEDATNLAAKANEATQEAILLEKEARMIGTEASLKASYDAGNALVKEIAGLGDPENPVVGTTIDEKIKYVEGVADRAIKKAADNNDIEAQEKIKELKGYYTSKLKLDGLIAQKTKLISDQIQYIKANNTGANDPEFKASLKKKMEAAVKEINDLPIYPNTSEEHSAELRADKALGIEKLNEIIKTSE
ncbi:MAG: hypothetical protein KBD47_01600 [Candidatus Pacebacteria bacterium]|jgi:hypothetical protein|nr:hypothetical protein [Candidatus Paceibacterota bacterium]